MITSARPTEERASHWYTQFGEPRYEVPRADGKGMRKSTIADARKNGWLPSPTTLLRRLAKPQLDTWKQEQACLAVLTAPRRDGEPIDEFVHRVLHVEREQDSERDIAADKGTAIHDALECALNDAEYAVEFRPYVEAVMGFLKPLGVIRFTEKVLVGTGYAGRTDAVLENDQFISVIDFKGCTKLPTKGAWPEHRMQIAAYCGALGNTGDKIIRGVIVYLNRNIPGEVIAHEVIDWREEYEAFMHLVRFWYASNRMNLCQ